MTRLSVDGGSFRDPSGRVYSGPADEVSRTVAPQATPGFEAVEHTGLLSDLVEKEQLVPYTRVAADVVPVTGIDSHVVLGHPRLPVVSYPYEWPFSALKTAALFHLDIQLHALERGVMLSVAGCRLGGPACQWSMPRGTECRTW